MNFVIPMAGRGERFKKAGFELPKMLIESNGKTLLEWSVDSLPLELCTNLIFIGLKEHKIKFNLENIIIKKYAKYNPQFIWLDDVTRGQAETVLMAEHLCDFRTDLLVFNIDTMFSSSSLKEILLDSSFDGILGAFNSNEARFSYAKLNNSGIVTETAEKHVISNYALTGLYHFKSCNDFFEIAKQHIEKDILSAGEFYIAPMYNELINRGGKFTVNLCDLIWILGTPEELSNFNKKYSGN